MDPLDEYRLESVSHEPTERRENRAALTIVTVVLSLFVGVLGFLVWQRSGRVAETTPANADTPEPVAGPAEQAVALPPLDESDTFVRNLLLKLSSRPELAAWLATDGLIRGFVAAVDDVASGATPARNLHVLAPTAKFGGVRRGSHLVISEPSYQRYTGLADTVASFDPSALARVYATLKPRLDEAYRAQGHPDGHLDTALEQALVHLLQAPVPEGDVVLKESISSFKFDNPELEELTPAQKQLIRMGPRNMRAIQRQLWAIARELGIPAERLPLPPAT